MCNYVSHHRPLVVIRALSTLIALFLLFIGIPLDVFLRTANEYKEQEVIVEPPLTCKRDLMLYVGDIYTSRVDSDSSLPTEGGYYILCGDSRKAILPPPPTPHGFIAKLLKLPEEPLDQEFCFTAHAYIGSGRQLAINNHTARVFIDKNGPLLVDNKQCGILAESGSLLDFTFGSIPIEELQKAFLDYGTLLLNVTGKPLSRGTSCFVDSDGSLKIDGKSVKAHQISDATKVTSTSTSGVLPSHAIIVCGNPETGMENTYELDKTEYNIHAEVTQELKVSARPIRTEIAVLFVATLTAWWFICFGFVKFLKQLWEFIVKLYEKIAY